MAELSPMMQQYFEIKKQHQDKILFYRLGDFYEMFFDDAITASKELDLTLTGRQCGLEERAPMCGVPYHSYETYLARLIAKGYKVAICEQMEDPALAKGLVKRDIIRVVTPGTVIESRMLQDDKNNYIASIYLKGSRAGVCFADISTGEAYVTELNSKKIADAVIDELCRFHPSELLINEAVLTEKTITDYVKRSMSCAVELEPDEVFRGGIIQNSLERQFGLNWTDTTGIKPDGLVKYAMGALVEYLYQTQKKGVERLKTITTFEENQFMQLSAVTRANLELTETLRGREKKGTLLWVLDKTKTAMGKRLLRTWIEQPLLSSGEINARLDAVTGFYADSITRADFAEELRYIADLERMMTRIMYGSASPKEVYALADTCSHLPTLAQLAAKCNCGAITKIAEEIDVLAEVKDEIYRCLSEDAPATLKDGGAIRSGYNKEIDELRELRDNSKAVLAELEARVREETGIPKLKIGFNHVFGYYFEVSNSYKNMVPDSFIRKQTLTTGERYITDELKTLESRILGASERLIILERKLFAELLEFVGLHVSRIQKTAHAVAQLDVYAAFAQIASDNNYCRPVVDDSDVLHIVDGRHPVVEQVLNGSFFVPNDTDMDCGDSRCLIITGPNMAGKSTYMRQNALIVLMAQIGSYVPAKECRVGVVDAIFTRVGASDDLASGQSTFMVEMTEVAEILKNATPKSLVVLDEIGRGTSTFDGMSIAQAVLEHISDTSGHLGCKTLFATHYHELTDLESKLPGIKNYSVAVKRRGEDITFLRKIIPGPADDSYGIEVARLAGLPGTVTRRAHQVLKKLEASAPGKNIAVQMDFSAVEEAYSPAVPADFIEKLEKTDVNTLTPIEALTFLYELKKSMKGSIQG